MAAKFQYILIDEFQDINRIQYDVIRMLAQPENNLFVVGDDDQAIYGFRGADSELMLGFGKDFPDAKQILLGMNYRSLWYHDDLQPVYRYYHTSCRNYPVCRC